MSKNKCKDCGQFISKTKSHGCANVDLKGPRFCQHCGRLLRNKGYERYNKTCSPCVKREMHDIERKQRAALKTQFGGVCQICGYSKCQAALHFHHLDPSEKKDWARKGKEGASSCREIKAHPERFQLVCANCHTEIHNPD